MVILPGITTSWTRNLPEEWLFRRELPAHGRGIHLKNVYSAMNYQLSGKESTTGMGFRRKLPAYRRGIHPRKGIPPGITCSSTLIQTGKNARKILRTVTIPGSEDPNSLYLQTFKNENLL
jgi:hypothetical protein